jgi:hypothetical protein
MKRKIGVYLTDDVAKWLGIAARRPGMTKSGIVNEALRRFLDPPPEKDHGEEVLGRLRGLAKRLRQVHRDVEIVAESFALFARYFLMINPPLPQSEQNAAEMLGRQRYEVFVRQIARRVASDRNLISDVMRTIVATHPDLATPAMANDAVPQHPSQPLENASHGCTRPVP